MSSPPFDSASTGLALQVTGLVLGHPGQRTALLEAVDFSVSAGECVAIEGPTGSGKSTLLRALAGLDTRLVAAGAIDCVRRPTLLAQHVEVQLLCTTVDEEVMLGLRQQGLPATASRARAATALAAVGLEGFATREVDTLSAGEKQRTLLAALLALEPSVLLLDEPTSALDAPSRRALAETLNALKRRGTAIVVVEHASAELASAFDRRWVIEKRRLVERPLASGRREPAASAEADPTASRSPVDIVVVDVPRNAGGQSGRFPPLGIGAGERILVTGPNGAGKSTWLRAIAGLAHARAGPVGMRARLADARAGLAGHGARSQAVQGDVALVIQEPRRALFARTAAEEIGFSLVRRGWSRAQREARVEELLLRFDLQDCAERSPLRASFGQQHRLAIAAALAARPSLALLDEPFAGIDEAGRHALLRILANEQRASNTAYVLASHDRAPLDRWCDRVIELPGSSAGFDHEAEGTLHG